MKLIIPGANFTTNAISGATPVTRYSVTYNLTNAISSTSVATVMAGATFTVTITPESGYTLTSVAVTHKGMAVVPTSGYTYRVASVSGNIEVTAVAASSQTDDYTSRLIMGYWCYYSETGRLLVSSAFGDMFDNVTEFIATTANGQYEAVAFGSGEITTTIPAGCKFRVCMLKKNDGSATNASSTDFRRSDSFSVTNDTKISSLNIPSILGLSPSTYPYWGINIGKSDGSDVTVAGLVSMGVEVKKTSNNVTIKQGYWATHIIYNIGSNYPKFVYTDYDGGFIPFSAGLFSIQIPSGIYRIVLCTTLDGTGSMCRTVSMRVESGVTTLSSSDLRTIMASNADAAIAASEIDAYDSSNNYVGWAIHYSKTSTTSAAETTPMAAIANGLYVTLASVVPVGS